MRDCPENIIDKVLTAATNVHRAFGPGLLENVYEQALLIELRAMGLSAINQVGIPVSYRNTDLGVGFRADIIVEKSLLLELKTVEHVLPIHMAQTITYLKLLNFKRGFILNFNSTLMKDGIKRVSI